MPDAVDFMDALLCVHEAFDLLNGTWVKIKWVNTLQHFLDRQFITKSNDFLNLLKDEHRIEHWYLSFKQKKFTRLTYYMSKK